MKRVFAYLLGCVAFVASFLVYVEYIHMLGFPDGFISELGRAERQLAFLFIGTSLMLGSYVVYLGSMASRKGIGKRVSVVGLLYVLFIMTLSLADYYFRVYLTGSGGG
ncbi:MAG: hypothetical protein H7Z42_02030 [Roseiflexaceae bacterium]|nr:hypothetical protein [Roseiflexaceae bacterium]